MTTRKKEKLINSQIDSAFINSSTRIQDLLLQTNSYSPGLKEQISVKIKLEVDVNPPLGFNTEERLLLKPYSCYIKCFAPEDLFAGKVHALLYRNWKNRVKGRDWYDLEWYIRKNVAVNLSHVTQRAIHSGDWNKKHNMSKSDLLTLINARIHEVDFSQAKADVARFLKDITVLEIWSKSYFLDIIDKLKFTSDR